MVVGGDEMKRWIKGFLVGIFVAIVGVGLGLSPLGAGFEQNVGIAWLFKVRGVVEAPGDVVVIAMDSRTGENLGLPTLPRDWPRSMHGRLVDELMARGASTIVFDVHFGREKSPADDQLFVDAVQRAGRVILVELLTGKRQPISDQQGRHVGMVWAEELLPPLPALAEAAAGLATFPLPKEGASVHQFWVFKESTDNAPTLPAVALQLHAREQTTGLVGLIDAVAPDAHATLPPLDKAFSEAGELRNFMRALRAIYIGAPDTLGAVESTSPTEPPILLEQALEGLYAGEANRFLNFYGPPGTITDGALPCGHPGGRSERAPRKPWISPARSCSSVTRTSSIRGSRIVSTPSLRARMASTSAGSRSPPRASPIC